MISRFVLLFAALGLSALPGARAAGEATPAPDARAVFFVLPGPAAPPGKSLLEIREMREHGAHIVKLHEAGKIVLAGPYLDGTGGFGVAAETVDAEELKRLFADDPTVKSGLLKVEVKTLRARVGQF